MLSILLTAAVDHTLSPTSTDIIDTEVPICTTTEVVNPTTTWSSFPLIITADSSSIFDESDYYTSTKSEEEIDKYKWHYEKEDDNLHFLDISLLTQIDGLESMIFQTVTLKKLKLKERILREKEDNKHYHLTIVNKKLYNQLTNVMTT